MTAATISVHHGGGSIGALVGPEREVAEFRKAKAERALRQEPPMVDVSPTARIFRIPNLKGYKHRTRIVRAKRDRDGNELEPQKSVFIEFSPCSVSPQHGEIILDPAANPDVAGDETRATEHKTQIEVIERELMRAPWLYLGIFDFHQEQAKASTARDAELAGELAKPGRLAEIITNATKGKLGVDLAGSMQAALEALRPKAPKAPSPGAEKP